jgi:hypothetical protein
LLRDRGRIENLGEKRPTQPEDDRLYNMLVQRAKKQIHQQQIIYKQKIQQINQIQSRIEQFLFLMQHSEHLRKKIESAKQQFVVTDTRLDDLNKKKQLILDKISIV